MKNNLRCKNPVIYARKTIKECGFKHPPICEKTIADHLKLKLNEFSLDDYPNECDELHKHLQIACASLKKNVDGNEEIYIYRDIPHGRKRLQILHECGHYILPWHTNYQYVCDLNDLNPIEKESKKHEELEAFKCASELLMPFDFFLKDMFDLDTGINAIKELSEIYFASFEATAIRYANTHPGMVSMAMLEPTSDNSHKSGDNYPKNDNELNLFDSKKEIVSKKSNPLRVKYSVCSKRFPKFIKPGFEIDESNQIYEAWSIGERTVAELPASIFGSSAKWFYFSELLPLGKSGKIMVLLWLKDNNLSLL